jgi:hypothetical protein
MLWGFEVEKSGQQTPRRWGWGTPLKKRAATRISQCYKLATLCQQTNDAMMPAPDKNISRLYARGVFLKVNL